MKMVNVERWKFTIVLLFCVSMLAACGGTGSTISSTPTTLPAQPSPMSTGSTGSAEQPVPVLGSSQVGSSDIPDTQTFVKYTSTSGKYQLDVPEGWAQTTTGSAVSFVSDLNALQVALSDASTPPTARSARTDQAITLQKTARAVRDVQLRDVQLASGPAVLLTYTSNSEPNPVTNKQVRLENNRYLFFKNGKLATLTLSAPVGADNVDQWARISGSLRWVA